MWHSNGCGKYQAHPNKIFLDGSCSRTCWTLETCWSEDTTTLAATSIACCVGCMLRKRWIIYSFIAPLVPFAGKPLGSDGPKMVTGYASSSWPKKGITGPCLWIYSLWQLGAYWKKETTTIFEASNPQYYLGRADSKQILATWYIGLLNIRDNSSLPL